MLLETSTPLESLMASQKTHHLSSTNSLKMQSEEELYEDDTNDNLEDDFSDIDFDPDFDEFDTDFDEYDDYMSEDDEF